MIASQFQGRPRRLHRKPPTGALRRRIGLRRQDRPALKSRSQRLALVTLVSGLVAVTAFLQLYPKGQPALVAAQKTVEEGGAPHVPVTGHNQSGAAIDDKRLTSGEERGRAGFEPAAGSLLRAAALPVAAGPAERQALPGLPGRNASPALAPAPVRGTLTYYGVEDGFVDGAMYCGGQFNPADPTIAAVSPGRYPCGTRLRVTAVESRRSITVTVKDHCGDCDWDHLDLSRAGFGALGSPERGRLDVSWVPLR